MKFKRSVVILGTRYQIVRKSYADMEDKDYYGYAERPIKQICIGLINTYPGYTHRSQEVIDVVEKETLRHEIIHAFLNESGLDESSGNYNGAWARNEEMVDFFAIQAPKIFKVFEELDIL